MMTVRFPNGQAVTYNDAGFLYFENGAWEIYEDKTKMRWIASIQLSAGCTVETRRPCRVENSNQIQTLEAAAKMVAENLRGVPGHYCVKLKRELEKFNRQTRKWRK